MSDDYIAELERRMQESEDTLNTRIDALTSTIRPRLEALEPVAREAAKTAQIKALEAQGKVVKDSKGMVKSATLQASVTGVITGLFAAWSAYEGGNLEAAGAALGAAVTAMIAIWGRIRVGDLK